MDISKRLFRKPLTTALWVLLCAAMSAFLLVGFSLWYSTEKLYETLEKNSVALAIRSDQGLIQRSNKLELEGRFFTQKDKAFLEGLDGVRAVRSHAVSAAHSAALSPLIEMQNHYMRYKSAGNPIPYGNAVLLAKCVGIPKEIMPEDEYISIFFQIEKFLLLGEEFTRVGADQNLLNNQLFRLMTPRTDDKNGITREIRRNGDLKTQVTFFEEGKTYVLAGYFDPGNNLFEIPDDYKITDYIDHILYMNNLTREEDILVSTPQEKVSVVSKKLPKEAKLYYGGPSYFLAPSETYALPAAQLWKGDPDAFFEETPHEIWRQYRDAWEAQQHSLPVVGTERLEAMYAFMADRVWILEGRSFTEEEYEQGAKVLVISRKLADLNHLKVGDRISLTQYIPDFSDRLEMGQDYVGMWPGAYYNNPSIDYMHLSQDYGTDEEPFTIVGTYELLSDWVYGPYDFGPNALLMPKKAQIAGAFGEIPQEAGGRDIYGMLLTVELVNGKMDAFMAQLERSDYDTQFFTVERGFEGVQKNLAGMRSSMLRLLALSAFGWGIFVILYLLMYQGSEKKNIGTMRSLGETSLRTSGYLFGGGWVIALAGILLGVAAGTLVLHLAQEGILRDSIASIDPTMEETARLAAEGKLTAMYKASALNGMHLALFGAAQLVFISLALGIHTAILSRRHPRALMEG